MPLDFLIAITLLIPLISALITFFCRHKPWLRDCMTVIFSVILFINIVNLIEFYVNGGRPTLTLPPLLPGLLLSFNLEPMGLIFSSLSSALWVITSLYSIGYMRANDEAHQSRFSGFMVLSIAAAMAISFSANLLTLFIFYELLTLCTYPLVTHSGTDEAKRSGRTYLILLLTTSMGLFFPAMIWIWHIAGTLDFHIGGIFDNNVSPTTTALLLVMLVYGTGKAALMPLHRWLPAAMVAPTPVSALLHAVAVVKAGIFTLLKIIVYIFGVDHLHHLSANFGLRVDWLGYTAGLTMIAASLIALRQESIKRMLAYSTVSQLSYMILAAALFTPKAITAALLHFTAHAFSKITLFFAAGSLYTAATITHKNQMDNIGKVMPITMIAFTIGSLSLIGIPPLAGFISKYYLLEAAFDEKTLFAVAVIIISTLLNAAYFLPVIIRAFWGKADHQELRQPVPLLMNFAMIITTLAIIIVMIFAERIMQAGKMMFYIQ